MAVIWTAIPPATPNNPDSHRVSRAEILIGYGLVALGAAAVGAFLAIVAVVIAGTW